MNGIDVRFEETDSHVIMAVNDFYSTPCYHRLSYRYGSIDLDSAKKYANSLVNHISYVREAGEKIGVDKNQLRNHDISKWSREEFPHYALNFFGNKSQVNDTAVSDAFARAWLHHIHNNPHHWQYWIFSDEYTPKNSNVECGVVEMPQKYALEMIADWMGASMADTGSWDMTEWLQKNFNKIRLHSNTLIFVRDKLYDMGYTWLR